MSELPSPQTIVRLDDYRSGKSPIREPDLMARVEERVEVARAQTLARQRGDGHFVYELEADATIPSEYVLLEHFLGEIDAGLEAELAVRLRSSQSDKHDGWPLYHDGDFNISASVKAYYALKLVGDSPSEPHMERARNAILAHGGAARSNVFTRFSLALFEQVPWRACPTMPVELMLLPRWFPFHLDKVAYWSRTVIVPLVILAALRPRARNPGNVDIRELFIVPPEEEQDYLRNPTGARLGELFLLLDRVLKAVEPTVFARLMAGRRRKAIEAAAAFITERLNGEDGLGGIFPAMTNTVMAFIALGYPADHPHLVTAKTAVSRLVVRKGGDSHCQPCFSPAWDTGLVCHALLEAGEPSDGKIIAKATDWLLEREITDMRGDWSVRRPDLKPGGWAFQYRNDHYPDVDDTAVVAMALDRAGAPRSQAAVKRAAEWVLGMQSRNGGWGSFDADNTHAYLNHIPFADHGALLDPPTADVSARCLGMLAQLGYRPDHPAVRRAIAYLLDEQEADGSWFGRWGTNYVYGTWSVLSALNAVGVEPQSPTVRRAVSWLKERQRPDGGWGEDGATYHSDRRTECKESTPSQTAWALLALMAVGEVDSPAVQRGIEFLVNAPREADGRWVEPWYTAVGFPRVFYLRYHGYAAYFPLWALARYRNLKRANSRTPGYGI